MSGCVQLRYNLSENISYWTTLIQPCSSSVFNHHTRPEGVRPNPTNLPWIRRCNNPSITQPSYHNSTNLQTPHADIITPPPRLLVLFFLQCVSHSGQDTRLAFRRSLVQIQVQACDVWCVTSPPSSDGSAGSQRRPGVVCAVAMETGIIIIIIKSYMQ